MTDSRFMTCRTIVHFCSLLFAVACVLPAHAQTVKPSEKSADPDAWRFNTALYGWLISVSGNVTARGQTIDTNAGFIDLVQQSQSLGAFMGYFEADKGKAGVYLDLVYTSLGFGAYNANYRNPIAGLKLTTSSKAALTYQLMIAEVGGVYELARWQRAEASSTSVDGVMGFRYWNNSVDAGFDAIGNVDFSRLHFDGRYSYAWDLDGGQKLAALLGFRALGVNYGSAPASTRSASTKRFTGRSSA